MKHIIRKEIFEQMKYYIDTCIWRDYAENRSDRFRPLGDWARAFLNKCLQEKHTIVYSDVLFSELKVAFDDEKIFDIFEPFQDILEKIDISSTHIKEARTTYKQIDVSFIDIVHAIVAKECTAVLITQDKHFEQLRHIVEICRPEDLL